jgi:hypothetical protein
MYIQLLSDSVNVIASASQVLESLIRPWLFVFPRFFLGWSLDKPGSIHTALRDSAHLK